METTAPSEPPESGRPGSDPANRTYIEPSPNPQRPRKHASNDLKTKKHSI